MMARNPTFKGAASAFRTGRAPRPATFVIRSGSASPFRGGQAGGKKKKSGGGAGGS